MELNEIELPDGRTVDLVVDPEAEPTALKEGWLLDAQGRQERPLTSGELFSLVENDGCYEAITAVLEELLNEQDASDEEARAEMMDGDHGSALESVYGPND
jgi:hypothetical protein